MVTNKETHPNSHTTGHMREIRQGVNKDQWPEIEYIGRKSRTQPEGAPAQCRQVCGSPPESKGLKRHVARSGSVKEHPTRGQYAYNGEKEHALRH